MGQERLRGIQERLQRLCSHATSCKDRYKVVVGLGAGKSISFLRQRKDKVQRRKCRSAVTKCFGVVYAELYHFLDNAPAEVGFVYFLQIALAEVETFCYLAYLPRKLGIFHYPVAEQAELLELRI